MINREDYEKQLIGNYLEAYEEVKGLCHNFSFFMNDDDYYSITILDETLDLLLEAQGHHQPVEYVLGKDLSKYMYLHYKECSHYHFSYGNMGVLFCIIFFCFSYLFPNAFAYHYMETEYYIVLLLPFITKIFYLLNQNICLKMFFQLKERLREGISYTLFGIEVTVCIIFFIYQLSQIEADMLFYNILFLFLVGCIVYRNRKNQNIGFIEWIDRTAKSSFLYTLFVLEIILIISGFAWLSHRISPFITTTSFQWFIPTLLCVYLTTIPLRGLKKKKIHYQYSETELLDQYLSHCLFFITK